jgi:hypothetical protein
MMMVQSKEGKSVKVSPTAKRDDLKLMFDHGDSAKD